MSEKNTLEGFEGWDDAETIDLFQNTPDTGAKEENILDKVHKDDIAPKASEEEEDDDEGEEGTPGPEVNGEEDLFGSVENQEGEEEDDEDEGGSGSEDEAQKTGNIGFLNSLKERGLVDYELEEGEELTEELADEIIEDSLDQRFETMLEEKLSALDPDVQEIVKHNMKGGNFNDLLNKMVPKAGIKVTADMDLEEENVQASIIKRDRLEKGDSEEEAETYTEFLKDSGKLKGMAEKLHEKFLRADKEVAKQEAAKVEQQRKQRIEDQRETKRTMTKLISTEKDFNGLKLNRKDKKELPSYIVDTSVKLENGRSISPLQRDIMEAMKDEKKIVLLAKLVRDDFNLEDLGKAERTKRVGQLKDDIRKGGKKERTTKPNVESNKSLADYF